MLGNNEAWLVFAYSFLGFYAYVGAYEPILRIRQHYKNKRG